MQSRYSAPTPESFRGPIAEDEFDMAMAKTEEDGSLASNARASKMWRTLRIASKSKLNVFDKIDDGNNLQALFVLPSDENESESESKMVNDSDSGDLEVAGVTLSTADEMLGLQSELDSIPTEETIVK